MELIIKDIKNSLRACSPDELKERITIWRNQFRQQGISIIALESLLNFYHQPHRQVGAFSEDGFMSMTAALNNQDEDSTFQTMRSEVNKLTKEKRQAEASAAKWRKCFFTTLLFSILFVIILTIIVLVK